MTVSVPDGERTRERVTRSFGPVGGWPIGPAVVLVAEVLLLGTLDATVGLGPAGWPAALLAGAVGAALLARALRRAGRRTLGAANTVTATRAVLVGGVTALAADSLLGAVPVGAVVALTVPALLLDAVDGVVARRHGLVSALGARFDMEVDAFAILALSVLVAGSVGGWVLAIGLMRYAFVAACWLLPWLAAPLPTLRSRKVVAAVQGIVLVTAVAGVLPHPVTVGTLLAALAALCWSFGRDVRWLHRAAGADRA
jgi:phosphatidylglycerophosphate synthase